MNFVTAPAKSAAVVCLRVLLAILSGWLAWTWFVKLFAMGEAGLVGPVPLLTKFWVWAIFAGAALVMSAVGLLSHSVPWRLCVLATAYPLWGLAEEGVAITVAVFIFFTFLLSAALGSKVMAKLRHKADL